MTTLTRDAIFIGHANPEDNEFTVWLGTRLTAASASPGVTSATFGLGREGSRPASPVPTPHPLLSRGTNRSATLGRFRYFSPVRTTGHAPGNLR